MHLNVLKLLKVSRHCVFVCPLQCLSVYIMRVKLLSPRGWRGLGCCVTQHWKPSLVRLSSAIVSSAVIHAPCVTNTRRDVAERILLAGLRLFGRILYLYLCKPGWAALSVQVKRNNWGERERHWSQVIGTSHKDQKFSEPRHTEWILLADIHFFKENNCLFMCSTVGYKKSAWVCQ